jgi:hypothetical protein
MGSVDAEKGLEGLTDPVELIEQEMGLVDPVEGHLGLTDPGKH